MSFNGLCRYNLTADRAETTDLWESQRPLAKAMLRRFQAWQATVFASQQQHEIGCADPMPPVAYTPIPHEQDVQARCSSENGNRIATVGADSAQQCAEHTAGRHGRAFSWSAGCEYCWIFKTCDVIPSLHQHPPDHASLELLTYLFI